MFSLMTAAVCLGLVSGVVPVSATAFSADWFAPEKRALALGAAFLWQDCGMVISLLGGQYMAQATSGFRLPFVAFSLLFLASAAVTFVLPHGARATAPAAEVQEQ
jgi:MFS family permease